MVALAGSRRKTGSLPHAIATQLSVFFQPQRDTGTPSLGEVSVHRGGDALVSGDMTLQTPRELGYHQQHAQGMAERGGTPGGICERLLSLQAQAAPRTTQQTRSMTSADSSAAAAMTGRRDLLPPGVTAAGMSVTWGTCPAAMVWTIAAMCTLWMPRERVHRAKRDSQHKAQTGLSRHDPNGHP